MSRFARTAALAALLAGMAGASPAEDGHDEHAMATGDDHGEHDMTIDAVRVAVTINSVSGDTVNLTHGVIPEIGWPEMTMDLPLLHGADASGLAAGDSAIAVLEKGPDGMYGIRAFEPAE